jgi:hypothetical protein
LGGGAGEIFEHDQVGRDRLERLGGGRRLGLGGWRDSQQAWTTYGWKPDHVAQPEMPTSYDGKGVVYGLAFADFDGDGWPDIVAARSDAPNAIWFSTKLKSGR